MNSLFEINEPSDVLRVGILLLLWLILWLGPIGLGLNWASLLLGLPLRRLERARMFLDLLEIGLREGRTPESTLVAISSCRDRSLGLPFHLLACHLEEGCRLPEALIKVPRLLPPAVNAMLTAGAELGDYRRVLPACRQLLGDARSQTQSAVNYLVILAFVFTPLSVIVVSLFATSVLPQLSNVAISMIGTVPPELQFLMDYTGWLVVLQVVLVLFLWGGLALGYIGGPRLAGWGEFTLAPLIQRVQYRLPWRRLRMRRDFAAMLAILLDAGMPEPRALELAAECTANVVFRTRARKAIATLAAGGKLTDAVANLDEAGEFQWRLRNAAAATTGFYRALQGWMESLDARAFQREQATAQLVSTALVVFNGVLIGGLAYCCYRPLVALVEAALLW